MSETLEPWTIQAVPGPAMADWCRALNDDNPIHVDRAAAERLGFGPRCVNPGPANLAYLLNMVMAHDPAAEIARVEARFLANLLENDAAVGEGELASSGAIMATLHRAGDQAAVVEALIELRDRRA